MSADMNERKLKAKQFLESKGIKRIRNSTLRMFDVIDELRSEYGYDIAMIAEYTHITKETVYNYLDLAAEYYGRKSREYYLTRFSRMATVPIFRSSPEVDTPKAETEVVAEEIATVNLDDFEKWRNEALQSLNELLKIIDNFV